MPKESNTQLANLVSHTDQCLRSKEKRTKAKLVWIVEIQ